MSNTAEENLKNLKNNLIDFASQGGDQRTQGTAEELIDSLLEAHTTQRLTTVKEKLEELDTFKDVIRKDEVLTLIEAELQ